MKRKIYIFNPENDMALATGRDTYTPTPAVATLRRDLQMLPVWWCESGSEILSECTDADMQWIERNKHLLVAAHADEGFRVRTIDKNHLFRTDADFHPWGWSIALRHQLLSWGVPQRCLPSVESLNVVRDLSSRVTTVAVHQQLAEVLGRRLCPAPKVLLTAGDIAQFMRETPHCFLKTPWSSSGRGLLSPRSVDDQPYALRFMEAYLRSQGAVMGEVAYDKIMDFAMEFRCHDGRSEFDGYSVFENDSHHSFSHGVVGFSLGDEVARCTGVPIESLDFDFDEIRCALAEVLTRLVAPHYSGIVGVDMLLYRRHDGTVGINPCVEMNVRCTMGMVACRLGRLLAGTGTFHVEYHKEGVADYIRRLSADMPLRFDAAGKISSGVLWLTPVYPDSKYCAYIRK